MEIKIIFNNESVSKELFNGWGFSCLIDNRILFDTGEKSEYLLKNMKHMNINISDIDTVIISHEHWDHVGGLWKLLSLKKGLKVYVCPGFSKEFKEKIIKADGILIESYWFAEIEKNIFITGEIPGKYKKEYLPEQAMVIQTKKGLAVITGCAHPGIVYMLRSIKNKYPGEEVYFVFGGFHLMDKDKQIIEIIVDKFKEMKVDKVGPTHCSGKEAEKIFKERYGDSFMSIKAGRIFEI